MCVRKGVGSREFRKSRTHTSSDTIPSTDDLFICSNIDLKHLSICFVFGPNKISITFTYVTLFPSASDQRRPTVLLREDSKSAAIMRLALIPLLVVIYLTQTQANGREKRSIATGRGSFRPAKRDIDTADVLDDAEEVDKPLVSIASGSLLPGKRSLALGRNNFRPGKRMDTLADEVDKRSLALGRNNFRPGKRDYTGGEDAEAATVAEDKRSAAFGRFNFRPGKRSLALGRINFRPGKRSLALGRSNFRPGKRATTLPCSYDSMVDVAENAEYLFALLEEYEKFFATCQVSDDTPSNNASEARIATEAL